MIIYEIIIFRESFRMDDKLTFETFIGWTQNIGQFTQQYIENGHIKRTKRAFLIDIIYSTFRIILAEIL